MDIQTTYSLLTYKFMPISISNIFYPSLEKLDLTTRVQNEHSSWFIDQTIPVKGLFLTYLRLKHTSKHEN